MDTVTQALLGAAIGDAGFRHRLGSKAPVLGALCGIFPDLDLISRVAGPWASLIYHRGPTHSLILLTLLTPLLAYLGYRWSRCRGSWKEWGWLAWLALVTHPLLDVCTSYGTQLLWPLTDHRFAIDAGGVIDPLYTLSLLAAVLLCRIPGLRRWGGRWIAGGALVVTTLYLSLGFGISRWQIADFRSRLESEGRRIVACRSMPMPLSLLVWRQVARDTDGVIHVEMRSLLNGENGRAVTTRRAIPPYRGSYMKAIAARPEGQTFLWFSGGFHTVTELQREGRTLLFLADQRYGSLLNPQNTPFGAEAVIGPDGSILSFTRVRRRGNMGSEISALWAMMWGREPSS
ncbi:MAG: metal-dependent hydrolase [Planctomycetota bacterium]|jgi:inner membrane protein